LFSPKTIWFLGAVRSAGARRLARISVAYNAEGFAEPEGEIESVLVMSRELSGAASSPTAGT
jgi:hypothetical protein